MLIKQERVGEEEKRVGEEEKRVGEEEKRVGKTRKNYHHQTKSSTIVFYVTVLIERDRRRKIRSLERE